MRPPRIVILILFLASSFFLIGRAIAAATQPGPPTNPHPAPKADHNKQSVWNYMYYNTPFSLFPPNAAISLTDDNSTSFAARPAAFGPKLATRGLSGQLWVGRGFTENTGDEEGELGCSDLPGWDGSDARSTLKDTLRTVTASSLTSSHRVGGHAQRRNAETFVTKNTEPDDLKDRIALRRRVSADNLDSYVQDGLVGKINRRDSFTKPNPPSESPDIEGKVVLLMRGGCGFLEKVMWAQRRGARAVIVGDNTKGGPLIQMFAHGEEVDNVTIPSVFTARTTAQLLSSLTQPGSFIEDSLDEHGNPVLKVQQPVKSRLKHNNFHPDAKNAAKPVGALEPRTTKIKRSTSMRVPDSARSYDQKRSWLAELLSSGHTRRAVSEEVRTTESGDMDWILVEDWNEEKDKAIKATLDKTKGEPLDPDFMGNVLGSQASADRTSSKFDQGSHIDINRVELSSDNSPNAEGINLYKDIPKGGVDVPREPPMPTVFGIRQGRMAEDDLHDIPKEPPASDRPDLKPHDGLWVTITPTSSASPFFDTLLVLVISPLVTLTVVYALLILRARIRRRRWRAPKSVVERLPVRTYHTVAASPSPSPRQPSPSSTSPTTPLLQQSPPYHRPRSRTTTGIPDSDSVLTPTTAIPTPRPSSRQGREPEKGSGGFSAEWKKYMGRQVECVVCLEEYIDGVSRVMSLPCGHEFHADCITPWLTTRRRTCPICKGDVVRSLARGPSSSPHYEPYHDDSDDEPIAEASGSGSRDDDDLEQGALSPEPRNQDGWLSIWPGSYSSSSRRSPTPDDRDR